MTDDREQVKLYPLTLVIISLASMFIGVVLAWLAPAVNGTRNGDCAAFWEAEEKAHREGMRRAREIYEQRGEAKELIGSFSNRKSND